MRFKGNTSRSPGLPQSAQGTGGNVRSRNPPPRRRAAPEGCSWAPDVVCASSCGSGSDPAGGGGAGSRAGRGRARCAAALAPPPAAQCPRVPPDPRTSAGPRPLGLLAPRPRPSPSSCDPADCPLLDRRCLSRGGTLPFAGCSRAGSLPGSGPRRMLELVEPTFSHC